MGQIYFHSPTEGRLTIRQAYGSIMKYMQEEPERNYKMIVGTDSQSCMAGYVQFVTAIIIYRISKGGRFFYCRVKEPMGRSIKQRIYYETAKSLEIASKLTHFLAQEDIMIDNLEMEIHLDVGVNGPTRELIKEVVGMVTGSGYDAKIKPDSYGASKVADKFTK